MSNSLAIAAVTATLKRILDEVAVPLPFDPPDSDLTDCTCSAKPPDKARASDDANQLNLFLYQTALNPAQRNLDMPGTRPGETGPPALALNLYYLLTAYGRNNDDVLAHRVLGRAMSLLHDHALLMPSELESALPLADLGQQIERVRITPHTLGGEELSKLWAIFQAPYRVTTAYQVAVVLIDSARPRRTPLPVLRRSIQLRPVTDPPLPTVAAVVLPRVAQPSARLGYTPAGLTGDPIRLTGHDLAGDTVTLELQHRLLESPNTLPVAAPTDRELVATLPADQDAWPAGTYTVAARIATGLPARLLRSNGVGLTIAPRLVGGVPGSYARVDGVATIPIKVSPKVWPAQKVSLLIGAREIPAPPRLFPAADLSFAVGELAAGDHAVRLRVDGVDSLVLAYSATEPPTAYDSTQKVTIT